MKKKSLLGANDDWNMCMMHYVVADTAHKCTSKNTHASTSHHHNISFTLLDCLYDGFTRFSTTQKLYSKVCLEKKKKT